MTPNTAKGRRTGSVDTLMALAARNGVSRREFIRRMGGAGAVMLGGPALLAACGTPGTASTTTAAGTAATTAGGGGAGGEVFVDNWILYMDTKEDSYDGQDSIDIFQQQTGIKVTYTEGVNSNEEWFGKYQGQLAAGQATGFDIVVLTDYMAAKMIRLGYAEKIDHANVPNMGNLVSALQSPSFDPTRDYTLPWQSGFTGIGYDTDQTGGEVTSLEVLFDPKYKGKVGVLSGYIDTIGLLMLYEGKDPATASLDDAIATTDTLAKLVKDGQVRQVYGNDYIDALINGDLAIALAWSGDIIVNQVDSPQLEFAFPDEGVMIWTDNMLIPKGAANKANAEAWMNFYYDPAVAARLSYYVQYVSPVQGAKEAMLEIDADVANDPTVFPDQTILDKAHIFRSLTEDEETQLNEAVAKATGV